MNSISKYIKHSALVTFLLITLGACKKSFLELEPKGRVIATKTTDYDLLLNNLDLINIGANGQVLMGDEVCSLEPYFTGANYREKQLFKWQADVYNESEDATETLVPVKDLYIYNKIINEVLGSTEGSEATKKSLQAEAYAGRAWTYFLLVNYYGKPYDPATAATDPGFPLITEANVNATDFKRATVKKIYDLIVSDLTTAIPNLDAVGVPHRIRMSKAAAQGLLAKVYIFMGKFEDALPLLNESISNLAKSKVPTVLVDYNTAYPGFPTVPNDLENVYAKSLTNVYLSGSNRLLWLTPEAAALFTPNDVRFTKRYVAGPLPNGENLYRFQNTTVSFFGVRIQDLLLLRAEVKARLNNLEGAADEVFDFRKHRMPVGEAAVPSNVSSEKVRLLKFIMEERIREFALQGFRWFDMRRLSVDPLFAGTAYQHKIYGTDGVVKETITLTPNRFVLRIPAKIMAENPNMENNP